MLPGSAIRGTPVTPARQPDAPSSVITARPLFDGELLRVEDVEARPAHAPATELEGLPRHTVMLPYRGVLTTHFSRRDLVVTSANHALLLSACVPRRCSSPREHGERALALLWSDEALDRIAPDAIHDDRFDAATLARAPLLPPRVLVARERLRRMLATSDADPLEIEERSIELLTAVLRCARRASDARRTVPRRGGGASRALRIERVKSALAADPTRRWTLTGVSALAGVSPLHLARIFRAEVGTSVYEYVTLTRLAIALERVVEDDADLTTIALDAGFSSHSHFTARFRARFGSTPSEMRGECRRGSECRRSAMVRCPPAPARSPRRCRARSS